MTKTTWSGWHLDYLRALESEGLVKIVSRKINSVGVELVDVLFEGELGSNTMFPSTWSMETCCNKIIDSMNNIITGPFLDKGNWVIITQTDCGVLIRNAVTPTGELLSSYPLFDMAELGSLL